MSQNVCLDCGHVFRGRVDSPDQRRCATCHSREIMRRDDYRQVKIEVLQWMIATPFGIAPLWDIVRVVIGKRGMKVTDSLTVALMKRLHKEITDDLAQGRAAQQILDETRTETIY